MTTHKQKTMLAIRELKTHLLFREGNNVLLFNEYQEANIHNFLFHKNSTNEKKKKL